MLAIGVAGQGAFAAYHLGLPAIAPALQGEFGLGLIGTGLALTAANAGALLALVAWGGLADRAGERVVIAAGLLGASASLCVAASTSSFAAFLMALVAAGALGASVVVASGRATMQWFGPGELGMAMGIRQMATPLGGALAAFALPLLVIAGGLRLALLFLAGVAALAGIVAGWWLRPPPGRVAPAARGARRTLRDGRLHRLALGGALLVAAQLSLLAYFVVCLDEHGVDTGLAAVLLGLVQIGGAVARVLAGRLSDRRRRRILPMRQIALVSAVLFVLTAMAALESAPLVLLVAAMLVTGTLSMSSNGLGLTATGELAGAPDAGVAMGLQNSALFAAAVAGPLVFGTIVTLAGWSGALLAAGAASWLGGRVLRPLEGDEARGWARPQPEMA
jgi:MFS family permease